MSDDHTFERRQVLGLFGAASAAGIVRGRITEDAGPDESSRRPNDATTEPHTLATYRALVTAFVPKTPSLAAEREDPAQEPGAGAIELSKFVVWGLNNFVGRQAIRAVGGEGRLAEPVAAVLDVAASELLARNRNESDPDPTRYPAGGPFAALAPRDRFRAMRLIEDQDLDLPRSELPAPFDTGASAVSLNYLVAGLHAIAFGGYYSEWAGYGASGLKEPTEWAFTEDVPSWEQTDYPGPATGYAGYRYVLKNGFREGDYPGSER